ncbi:Uncharacterised protein [Bordetella pertussis]|nr:Uncharacterised protein [Bordetella pertussis]
MASSTALTTRSRRVLSARTPKDSPPVAIWAGATTRTSLK